MIYQRPPRGCVQDPFASLAKSFVARPPNGAQSVARWRHSGNDLASRSPRISAVGHGAGSPSGILAWPSGGRGDTRVASLWLRASSRLRSCWMSVLRATDISVACGVADRGHVDPRLPGGTGPTVGCAQLARRSRSFSAQACGGRLSNVIQSSQPALPACARRPSTLE
jgi:hypothetical protein